MKILHMIFKLFLVLNGKTVKVVVNQNATFAENKTFWSRSSF